MTKIGKMTRSKHQSSKSPDLELTPDDSLPPRKPPDLKLAAGDSLSLLRPVTGSVETFIKRCAEVAEKDHAGFQDYLVKKAEAERAAAAPAEPKPDLSRRTMLKVAVGASIVGEAAAAGLALVRSGSVSEQGFKHGGENYTAAHDIVRELVDTKAD